MNVLNNTMGIEMGRILILLLGYIATIRAEATCPEGTYLQYFEDKFNCAKCPHGTFMPWKDHPARKCFECTKIVNTTVEVLITPCDRSHDADIRCVERYYRRLARNPREEPTCLKCRESCPEHFFKVHRCENFNDIGCCPGENYDYYIDKSGVRMCRERPWMCGRGEYLDIHINDCKPCPENTFMSEDYHSHTSCWDCGYKSEADLPLHATIIENCTINRPAKYGCKAGFFVNHGMSYRRDDIGCSPCKICDDDMYVGQHCDMYHNTVCCDKPHMSVVDGPRGGRCINIQEEVLLYPQVGALGVKQGSCQSIVCYIALPKRKKKPTLEWVGPNVSKQQQFQFEKENNQSDEIVYYNTLTVCGFSAANEGMYRCKDSLGTLRQDTQIDVVLACRYGTYNPPACTKSCSQHCRVGERSDGSPCDHNNGACLFGCLEGYTGSLCDTRQDTEKGSDKSGVFASTIAISVILVLVLTVVIICIVYNKPCREAGQKWWRSHVSRNLSQRTTASYTGEHQRLLGVTTQNDQKNISKQRAKSTLEKAVKTLQEMDDFRGEAAVKCHKDISEIFWNFFDSRTEIGDYAVDLFLPDICLKIGERYITDRANIKDDETWAIVIRTYQVARDYSANSPKFARRLADLGLIKFLTKILSNKSYLDNLNQERDIDIVKAMMAGLRHMASYAGDVDDLFKESKTLEVLMHLINSNSDNANSEEIKQLAEFTVDTIRENRKKTTKSESLELQELQSEEKSLSVKQVIKKAEKEVKTPQKMTDHNTDPETLVYLELQRKEKSLSVKQVIKKAEKEVRTLQKMTHHNTDQGIKCQQSICQIFWEYFAYKKDIGDQLAELGFPATCVKILRHFLDKQHNDLKDDKVWLIIVHTYSVCRNYSAGSVRFAKSLAKAGAVKLMTSILSKKSYLGNLHKQGREYDVVKVSIVGLRLLASYAGNTDDFKKSNTAEVLMPLAQSDNKGIKLLAEITVNCITKKEGKNDSADTPVTPLCNGDAAKTVEEQQNFLEESHEHLKETKDEANISCSMHNVDIPEKIKEIFVAHIKPKNIVHIFPFYDSNILEQTDIDAMTSNGTAAEELLNRLAKHKEWYNCLLLVLRDPLIKEDRVADMMEKALGA